MSNGPRVAFLRFASLDSPKLVPWQEHTHRVTGRPAAAMDLAKDIAVPSIVVWHLISSNNRMLARSAVLYNGLDDAEVRAKSLIETVDQLETRFVSDKHGLYGWHTTISGAAAMTCSRWYLTERDRKQSVELAIASLANAELQPGARLLLAHRG